MKYLIGCISLIFSMMTLAAPKPSVDHYAWGFITFPAETSVQGLPEAIPCVYRTAYDRSQSIKCTWLENARNITVWDAQRQQDMQYPNQVVGRCMRGVCRIPEAVVGNWSGENLFTLSIWYRIGTSTDGKPVAYRVDTDRQVSYAEAGAMLYQFYLDIGVPDDRLEGTMDRRYEGGYSAFVNDQGNGQQKASHTLDIGEIKEAWCNPQADDECYLNDTQVPKADLGKYLPSISDSQAAEQGGWCEYPLCYNGDNKVIGVRQ